MPNGCLTGGTSRAAEAYDTWVFLRVWTARSPLRDRFSSPVVGRPVFRARAPRRFFRRLGGFPDSPVWSAAGIVEVGSITGLLCEAGAIDFGSGCSILAPGDTVATCNNNIIRSNSLAGFANN